MYVLRRGGLFKEFSQAEMYDMFIEAINREFPNNELVEDKSNYFFSSVKYADSYWDKDKNLIYPCLYESDYLQRIKDESIDDVDLFFFTTHYNKNIRNDLRRNFTMSRNCRFVQRCYPDTWIKFVLDNEHGDEIGNDPDTWEPLGFLKIKGFAMRGDEKEYTLSGGENVSV